MSLSYRREVAVVEKAVADARTKITAMLGRDVELSVDFETPKKFEGDVGDTARSIIALRLLTSHVFYGSSGVVAALAELTKDSLGKEAFNSAIDRLTFVVTPGSKEETQIVKDGRTIHFTFVTTAKSNTAGNADTFPSHTIAKKLEALL